ncbi:hypothetical protein WN51_11784 [Melipona quadrifasciata]|uniref:Uncharacterized protein n=1 Tax=Melipona quadrifasciata TaxID=166423 RepID=A0A0N0U618_9HYME|nr:hypothetical protein WN51_11784 [Melipona quadrifasciata]
MARIWPNHEKRMHEANMQTRIARGMLGRDRREVADTWVSLKLCKNNLNRELNQSSCKYRRKAEIREKDLERLLKGGNCAGKGWQDFQSHLEFKGPGVFMKQGGQDVPFGRFSIFPGGGRRQTHKRQKEPPANMA